MAGRRLMTLDVRELVLRLRAGESDRAVARDLGLARKTAQRYRGRAEGQGWLAVELPPSEPLDRALTEQPRSGRMAGGVRRQPALGHGRARSSGPSSAPDHHHRPELPGQSATSALGQGELSNTTTMEGLPGLVIECSRGYLCRENGWTTSGRHLTSPS